MPDNLTPEQRRKTMQAVKARDTLLERTLSSVLHRRGLRYRRCLTSLYGKPDFVFTRIKLVVFVDGDFWHGWRYPTWKNKLKEYWQKKIEKNRYRDRLNTQRLRRQGWTVLRFWSHHVERDLDAVVDEIAHKVAAARMSLMDEMNGQTTSDSVRQRR